MVTGGIETRLIICQLGILLLNYRHFSVSEGILRYIFIYAYRLRNCAIQEKSLAFRACDSRLYIYIYIPLTFCLDYNSILVNKLASCKKLNVFVVLFLLKRKKNLEGLFKSVTHF